MIKRVLWEQTFAESQRCARPQHIVNLLEEDESVICDRFVVIDSVKLVTVGKHPFHQARERSELL